MKYKRLNTLYFFIVSILGLIILLFLFLYTSSGIEEFQELMILTIFVVICLMGMLAAVSPSTCNALTKRDLNVDQSIKKYKGHHPECDEFESHTFNIGEKKLCAGCSGLFIGAAFAVAATILLILYGVPTSSGMTEFYAGFVLVLASFTGIYFQKTSVNVARFSFNLVLVVGSFLILLGLAGARSNLSVQIYYLFLTCIWIITRISLSEFVHHSVCEDCGDELSCSYR